MNIQIFKLAILKTIYWNFHFNVILNKQSEIDYRTRTIYCSGYTCRISGCVMASRRLTKISLTEIPRPDDSLGLTLMLVLSSWFGLGFRERSHLHLPVLFTFARLLSNHAPSFCHFAVLSRWRLAPPVGKTLVLCALVRRPFLWLSPVFDGKWKGFMVALVLSLTPGFAGESKGLTRARGISNQLFLAALSG